MTHRALGVRALLFLVVLGGLTVNAVGRLPCHDVCGSDIGRLYAERGVDRTHAPFFQVPLEYPPLIGLEMYAAGLPFERGARGRFLANAFVLGALALALTITLGRRFGARAWRWALAPPLLLEGLTNWDLLAVVPSTYGLLQWENGGAFGAGVLLGIGAVAKLYPGLFVPVLLAACVPARAWRRARDVLLGAIAGAGAFAIPVYAFAPDALSYFLHFHRDRAPSRGTVWFYVVRNPSMHTWWARSTVVHTVNALTIVLVAAGLIALLWFTARDRLDPIAACAIATMVFIVANKIYSPQYDLWLVPFFVLRPVRTKLVVAFYAASLAVFVVTALSTHLGTGPPHLYLNGAAVLTRLLVMVAIARSIGQTRHLPAGIATEGHDPAYRG